MLHADSMMALRVCGLAVSHDKHVRGMWQARIRSSGRASASMVWNTQWSSICMLLCMPWRAALAAGMRMYRCRRKAIFWLGLPRNGRSCAVVGNAATPQRVPWRAWKRKGCLLACRVKRLQATSTTVRMHGEHPWSSAEHHPMTAKHRLFPHTCMQPCPIVACPACVCFSAQPASLLSQSLHPSTCPYSVC
jgi:hypothetical protein